MPLKPDVQSVVDGVVNVPVAATPCNQSVVQSFALISVAEHDTEARLVQPLNIK